MRQSVTLGDKYTLEEGRAFMNGVQALVRLPMLMRRKDRERGLNTAGFISGYRGSPLGTFDIQLDLAKDWLKRHDIVFQRGINEDLGATAVWGTQHVPLFDGARKDGVFGLWYGKGPGVDRTGDVFKHANFAGTSALGGVLALAGDDHACKSSTLPNQSEYAFIDAEMPVLAPSTIDEVMTFGVKGIELSRFSGCWVGFKTISDLMDASTSARLERAAFETAIPEFDLPEGGLNIRLRATAEEKERLHRHYRLPAAIAFARRNGINRIEADAPFARIGIAASGKAWLHVLDALRLLGIGPQEARALGLRLWKVGMVWPLDDQAARAFGDGLETVLVVEERRAVIEPQLKTALYTLPDLRRPMVLGKRDAGGQPLVSDLTDLDTAQVAIAIFNALPDCGRTEMRAAGVAALMARLGRRDSVEVVHSRKPFFCAGCPHNTSTTTPEGSRATAGIGCHYMVHTMPDRNSDIFTHMGGEGITWVGQSPFTDEAHIFANLGDGTYFHSGLLAIRQAVSAGVNITYKILFNDAVAMTGGQHVDGELHPVTIAAQVAAEGVRHIVMVSDQPDRWRGHPQMPARVSFYHRDHLEAAEAELKAVKGCSVLIYDQMCATELRRRRKRGLMPRPPERLLINPAVCEGCGDCSVKSNCVAVGPLETELGRKRVIDQSACNVDQSCLKGFCPSFVAIPDARPRTVEAAGVDALVRDLPEPVVPALTSAPFNLLLTGIGGFGVTSLSAILGMAAHLDEAEVICVDQIGLAQRGGAVDAHLRMAASGARLPGGRITLGETDVVIAADMVTAHGKSCLPLMDKARTRVVLDGRLTPTAAFTLDTRTTFDEAAMVRRLRDGARELAVFDAGRLSRRMLGDGVYTIMILLGAAWQAGLLPLSRQAIEQAIRLNGAEVERNLRAFALGRAVREGRLEAGIKAEAAFDLEAFVARRLEELTAYQDAAWAARYAGTVARVAEAEKRLNMTGLTEAVARGLFKLMAYKDEYEVARLYCAPQFRAALEAEFDNPKDVRVWLAPPIFSERDAKGFPRKRKFGPWVFGVFAVLHRLKGLRGTPFDPFGYTQERCTERALISEYGELIDHVLVRLRPETHATAVELARTVMEIKGFGHVKAKSLPAVRARQAALRAKFDAPVGATAPIAHPEPVHAH